MAQLTGTFSISGGRRHFKRLATGNIPANNSVWNSLRLAMPSLHAEYNILDVVVHVENQQTLHVVTDDEAATIAMAQDGSTQTIKRVSERLRHQDRAVDSALEDTWLAMWRHPFDFPILRAEELILVVPPADDGGTPTGDYFVDMLVVPSR